MKDATTKERIYVSTDGTAGPYIMAPVAQLEELLKLLEANRIPFFVDEYAISLNGEPETTVVNLGREGNAQTVQDLLDSVG